MTKSTGEDATRREIEAVSLTEVLPTAVTYGLDGKYRG
jgi:hypothetical protein